jgi:hypothetical protein
MRFLASNAGVHCRQINGARCVRHAPDDPVPIAFPALRFGSVTERSIHGCQIENRRLNPYIVGLSAVERQNTIP